MGDLFAGSTSALSFEKFIQTITKPEARDIVRKINTFMKQFRDKTPESESDSRDVQDFLSEMEAMFCSHQLWQGASHEELDSAVEGLEKYLLTKLYDRTFRIDILDKERDDVLRARFAALQFIKPEHLEIAQDFSRDGPLLLAQKELKRVNAFKSPREKLVCLLNCCKVINNLLSAHKYGAGADDFTPVLIYVVIQAQPEYFASNLAFIERYRNSSRLVSESMYFFVQMQGAAAFVETVTSASLKVDTDEFIAHMLAAGALSDGELSMMQAHQAPASAAPHSAMHPPQPLPSDVDAPGVGAWNTGGGDPNAGFTPPPPPPPPDDLRACSSQDRSHSYYQQQQQQVWDQPFLSQQQQQQQHGSQSGYPGSVPPPPSQPPPQSMAPQMHQRFQHVRGLSGAPPPPPPYPPPPPPARPLMKTVAELEAEGVRLLLRAEESGQLRVKYPFLYASLDGLAVRDVRQLLEHYKELALKYEALSQAVNESASCVHVTAAAHPTLSHTAPPPPPPPPPHTGPPPTFLASHVAPSAESAPAFQPPPPPPPPALFSDLATDQAEPGAVAEVRSGVGHDAAAPFSQEQGASGLSEYEVMRRQRLEALQEYVASHTIDPIPNSALPDAPLPPQPPPPAAAAADDDKEADDEQTLADSASTQQPGSSAETEALPAQLPTQLPLEAESAVVGLVEPSATMLVTVDQPTGVSDSSRITAAPSDAPSHLADSSDKARDFAASQQPQFITPAPASMCVSSSEEEPAASAPFLDVQAEADASAAHSPPVVEELNEPGPDGMLQHVAGRGHAATSSPAASAACVASASEERKSQNAEEGRSDVADAAAAAAAAAAAEAPVTIAIEAAAMELGAAASATFASAVTALEPASTETALQPTFRGKPQGADVHSSGTAQLATLNPSGGISEVDPPTDDDAAAWGRGVQGDWDLGAESASPLEEGGAWSMPVVQDKLTAASPEFPSMSELASRNTPGRVTSAPAEPNTSWEAVAQSSLPCATTAAGAGANDVVDDAAGVTDGAGAASEGQGATTSGGAAEVSGIAHADVPEGESTNSSSLVMHVDPPREQESAGQGVLVDAEGGEARLAIPVGAMEAPAEVRDVDQLLKSLLQEDGNEKGDVL